MSETSYEGPLDVVRRLNDEAMALDDIATDYEDYKSPEYRELQNVAKELDAQNPLLGAEVVVYGASLTLSTDESGSLRPMSIVPEQKATPVKGTYYGYTVLPAYVTGVDRHVTSVVHIVKSGVSRYLDEYYNAHETTHFSYVWVGGAEVFPTLPKNAHSLMDLAPDSFTGAIDELIFDDQRPTAHVLKHLVGMTNAVLDTHGENDDGLNMQRISYLNSVGLLETLKLSSKDVVIADREIYLSAPTGPGVLYSTPDSMPLVLQSDMFDVLPSYTRMKDGTILASGPPELFATAQLMDGRRAMVPCKSIEQITTI